MRYNSDGTLDTSPKGLKPAAWRLKGVAFISFALFAFWLPLGSLMLVGSDGEALDLAVGTVCLVSGASCATCGVLSLLFVRRPEALRGTLTAACWIALAVHAVCFAVLFLDYRDFVVFSYGGFILVPGMLYLARQVG